MRQSRLSRTQKSALTALAKANEADRLLNPPMPDIRLLSTDLPDLLPMTGRTLGVWHVSDIIRDLCIRLGHYDEHSTISHTRMRLGRVVEWALIQMYQLQFPDRFVVLGELSQDGLYGTPDLYDCELERPHEFKFTFRSSAGECEVGQLASDDHPIHGDKFWRDRVQLQAYMYMLRDMDMLPRCDGVLEFLHVRGDYTGIEVDHHVWEMVCSERELDTRWNNLLQHRDTMIREGRDVRR